MDKNIKLKIGEFSKLCCVTIKTLRHYERIGLLAPHEVDEWTKYRYYDVSQLSDMVSIRKLKELGLSLEDIREMFEDRKCVPDKIMIEKKIAETKAEIARLKLRLTALRAYRKQKLSKMSKITIKSLPQGTIASFRKHLDGYESLGYLCYAVIGPEMQRIGCKCDQVEPYCFTIDYNRNHNPHDIDLEYCELVNEAKQDSEIIKFRELAKVETAVIIEHYGAYNFDETMAEVMKYIEQEGYTIIDEVRFSYIHGAWDCESDKDWVTEIQIPVQKI